MKSSIEFRSSKFPPYDGENDEINPGRWGKRLAEYLSEKLSAEGIQVDRISPEDWGWMIPIKNNDFPLWIGCGNYDEYPEDGFLCFIEPNKPVIRKLFKKIDTTEITTKVSNALEKVLKADPEIRDIKWVKE